MSRVSEWPNNLSNSSVNLIGSSESGRKKRFVISFLKGVPKTSHHNLLCPFKNLIFRSVPENYL